MKRTRIFVLQISIAAFLCTKVTLAATTEGGAAAAPATGAEKMLPRIEDLVKKREIEGQFNSANEQLIAVIQQLTGNQKLSASERQQLEGEEAKLRPQVQSYREQLDLINKQLERAKAGLSVATITEPPAEQAGSDVRRSVISNDIMVIWSKAKDIAWGYSKSLGKWAKQEMIASPSSGLRPSSAKILPCGRTALRSTASVARWASGRGKISSLRLRILKT